MKLIGLIALRLVGVVLQVLVQLVVGRMAGAAGLGVLQLFASWTGVLGELVAGGRATHTLKTLSVQHQKAARRQLFAYLANHIWVSLRTWLWVVAAALLAWGLFPEYRLVSSSAAASALLFAWLRMAAEGLKALGRPGVAVFMENAGPPVALLLGCALYALYELPPSPLLILGAYAAGILLTCAVLGLLQWRIIAQAPKQGKPVSVATSAELLPLWGSTLLSILFMNLPFLMMPMYATVEELGQFALAFKLVNVVSTVLILLAALFGPRFARALEAQDAEKARGLLRLSQVQALLIYAPAALLVAVFAQPLLSVFGKDFAAAEVFIWVLLAGQLVNAATGLPGVLLNMAGAGRLEFASLGFACSIFLLGCLSLGPAWGATGVAAAYTLSLAIKNFVSYALAMSHIAGPDYTQGEKLPC